jgi:hypothetical protein
MDVVMPDADANADPEQSQSHDYKAAVFDYIAEQRAKDPQYAFQLVRQLWENLSAAERADRFNLAITYCPRNDLQELEIFIGTGLLYAHIDEQADLAHELDRQFAVNTPASPEATT